MLGLGLVLGLELGLGLGLRESLERLGEWVRIRVRVRARGIFGKIGDVSTNRKEAAASGSMFRVVEV